MAAARKQRGRRVPASLSGKRMWCRLAQSNPLCSTEPTLVRNLLQPLTYITLCAIASAPPRLEGPKFPDRPPGRDGPRAFLCRKVS